jgi:hypothetical protein
VEAGKRGIPTKPCIGGSTCWSADWMSSNVAGTRLRSLIESALVERRCCHTSRAWIPRRSSAGRQELETGLADRPQERVRLPVGDVLVLKKRPIASKHAGSVGAAGNSRRSLSDQKWVRSSLRHRSRAVGATGPSCESADGGSAVTQLRLFPVSQCEKARSERRPS